MPEPTFSDAIRTHYETRYDEDTRLRRGVGRLELARVQEIVRRHLPPGPQRILDVGGATGVHAEWLLAEGHQVHLIDPLASHVERSLDRLGASPRFTATRGDARALPVEDGAVDLVLMFGPLYHLPERADRVTAWREAARVVVPGGLVLGMAISRFASLFDGLSQGYLFDEDFRAMVATDVSSGRHENPTGDPRWFTTAYFHRPEELPAELGDAGLEARSVVGVEGMAHWMRHLDPRLDDENEREIILESARTVESEPSLLGLSSHLIAVGRRA